MSFNKRILSAGAAEFKPSEHFKIVTYTGNSASDNSGTTQTITGVGFQPDLVWIKRRDGAENHYVQDSTRGSTKQMYFNDNAEEYNQTNAVTSFNSDGFVVSGYNGTNNNGETYVAYCWKVGGGSVANNTDGNATSSNQVNLDAGVSIMKLDSHSGSYTIGHGLGAEPHFVLTKVYSGTTGDWHVYHTTNDSGKWLRFNTLGAVATASAGYEYHTVNSSLVGNLISNSSLSYIHYAWKNIEGFSKFGTYTGNSSDNGPIIETGFEPALVIIKNSSDVGSWFMYDNVRSTSNPRKNYLLVNGTNQEASDLNGIAFLSNGFQILEDHDDVNDDGDTYVYMAWATDADEETPTLANSFNIETYIGTNAAKSVTGLGFSPGMVWWKNRSGTNSHAIADVVRGANKYVHPDGTNTENTSNGTSQDCISFDTDGFSIGTVSNAGSINTADGEIVAWAWKANDNEPTYNTNGTINSVVSTNDNAGFSVINYTGTGSNATIGHGLSAAPTFMLVKNLSSSSAWAVYQSGMGATKYMSLNETTGASTASNVWNDTAPTSTVASIGTWGPVNTDGDKHIMYAWTDKTGYSKFGSYTGDAQTNQTITTGFKPDFVLIKSTVGNANWRLYDTRRSIEQGFIRAHDTPVEYTDGDTPNIEIISTGFRITSGGVSNGINANGNLYTYYAFAKNVTSNTTLANSFNVIRYRGTGAARQVTTAGFRPDFVWTKRTSHTGSHGLFDSLRGTGMELASDSGGADQTSNNTITSFDSDGFTAGSNWALNNTNYDYIAWCWKAGNTWQSNITGTIASTVNANTANGFSIVKYTGTGSNGTVGHGLSATPTLIIAKNLDTAGGNGDWDGWPVYSSTIGNDKLLNLKGNAAAESTGGTWGSTTPTSTVFTVQDNNDNNKDGDEIIAYCFHSVSGFSKIGTYTGNGSTQSITGVGFKPDFIMFKKTSASQDWLMVDALRGGQIELVPNGTAANYTMTNGVSSFDDDGWTMGANNSLNTNSATYIYIAIKQNVTSNTTLANSFKPIIYTGNGSQRSITGVGFQPDFIWMKRRNSAQEHALVNSVIGAGRSVYSDLNSAEDASSAGITSFDSDGFSVGSSGLMNNNSNTYVALCWKAGNTWQHNNDGTIDSTINVNTGNGFSIVSYKGTGSAATVAHGLGAAPEVMFIKERSSSRDWGVYHKYNVGNSGNGHTERLKLNTNDANQDNAGGAYWNSTAPTSTVFSIGTEGNVNTSGKDYIAYCWAPKSGFSKFGSYSGSGSDGNAVSLGFQPDFVMIKRTNSTGGWLMFDSARNTSNPRNNRLEADNDSAATTGSSTKNVDFNATDFEANGSDTEVNASGSTYIYLAFKAN